MVKKKGGMEARVEAVERGLQESEIRLQSVIQSLKEELLAVVREVIGNHGKSGPRGGRENVGDDHRHESNGCNGQPDIDQDNWDKDERQEPIELRSETDKEKEQEGVVPGILKLEGKSRNGSKEEVSKVENKRRGKFHKMGRSMARHTQPLPRIRLDDGGKQETTKGLRWPRIFAVVQQRRKHGEDALLSNYNGGVQKPPPKPPDWNPHTAAGGWLASATRTAMAVGRQPQTSGTAHKGGTMTEDQLPVRPTSEPPNRDPHVAADKKFSTELQWLNAWEACRSQEARRDESYGLVMCVIGENDERGAELEIHKRSAQFNLMGQARNVPTSWAQQDPRFCIGSSFSDLLGQGLSYGEAWSNIQDLHMRYPSLKFLILLGEDAQTKMQSLLLVSLPQPCCKLDGGYGYTFRAPRSSSFKQWDPGKFVTHLEDKVNV